MTQQEEIRGGITEWVLEIRQYLINTEFAPELFTKPVDPNVLTIEFPKKLLRFLDRNNVVLKVERELPKNPVSIPNLSGSVGIIEQINATSFQVYRDAQQDMLKWHNDSLEPLI